MPTPCPPGHVPEYIFNALVGLCVEGHWDRALAFLQLISRWYPPTDKDEQAQYNEIVSLINEGLQRDQAKTCN